MAWPAPVPLSVIHSPFVLARNGLTLCLISPCSAVYTSMRHTASPWGWRYPCCHSPSPTPWDLSWPTVLNFTKLNATQRRFSCFSTGPIGHPFYCLIVYTGNILLCLSLIKGLPCTKQIRDDLFEFVLIYIRQCPCVCVCQLFHARLFLFASPLLPPVTDCRQRRRCHLHSDAGCVCVGWRRLLLAEGANRPPPLCNPGLRGPAGGCWAEQRAHLHRQVSTRPLVYWDWWLQQTISLQPALLTAPLTSLEMLCNMH